jgi:deazaflavin-dependent oxidoreductase (nitroreductase family)
MTETWRPLDRGRIRLNRLHAQIYRLSGGRTGSRIAGQLIVLLTTTGRRSGRERTTPVQAHEVTGDTVIVASNGGAAMPPSWLANVRSRPQVSVVAGTGAYPARARIAASDERGRMWNATTAANPRMVYMAQGREFPLVVLERESERGEDPVR